MQEWAKKYLPVFLLVLFCFVLMPVKSIALAGWAEHIDEHEYNEVSLLYYAHSDVCAPVTRCFQFSSTAGPKFDRVSMPYSETSTMVLAHTLEDWKTKESFWVIFGLKSSKVVYESLLLEEARREWQTRGLPEVKLISTEDDEFPFKKTSAQEKADLQAAIFWTLLMLLGLFMFLLPWVLGGLIVFKIVKWTYKKFFKKPSNDS